MKIKKLNIIIFLCLFLVLVTSCSEVDHSGQIQMPEDYNDLDGDNYKTVVKKLENAGFTNIELVDLADLKVAVLYDDGEIDTIKVNDESNYFNKGDWFDPNTKIVIVYHSLTEDKSTAKKTVEKYTSPYTSENPLIVDINNISSVKVGDYISVTGPASVYSSRGGIINVGGSEQGSFTHCGIRIKVNSYSIEADTISPGTYEDTFRSHAPKDFSEKPDTVGDTKYSGCRMTISGTVSKLLITEEDNRMYGIELDNDSQVIDLELFYE